eukprot:gene5797-7210_t
MSNIGNCKKCGVKVYQIEGFLAAKSPYHNSCFKCDTCGWKLTLTTYKSINDKVYCKNHFPVTGLSRGDNVVGTTTTDSKGLQPQLNAPKLDTVNNQVRGECTTQVTLDSISINKAVSAPKLDTVNDQVRGVGAGNVTLDSISINKAVSAPKLDTVNDQVRGVGAGGVSLDSISINKAVSAPKLDNVQGVHKGDVSVSSQ